MERSSDAPLAAGRRTTRLVFVCERRSRRALEMGVHWESGRLCAKTLHTALRTLGLDPAQQTYLNLFADSDPPTLDQDALARLRALVDAGAEIVAMGRAVQRALKRAELRHRRLIHPAARGAIRLRAAYQAHVAVVLR